MRKRLFPVASIFARCGVLSILLTMSLHGKLSPAEEAKIEELMSSLTLAEKVGQLQLMDGHAGGGWKPEHMSMAQQGVLGATFNVRGVKATNQMQSMALSARHKIPLIFAFDVVHGYRTVFPVPLGEAASWDTELAEACAAVAAKEARAARVVWTFAPVADIARDPRWGRIVEGAGEDPVLCAAFTAARVRGFQGKDLRAHDRILACLKHFAGSGAAEGGRDYNAADLSPRVLWQVHLPPFKAGLDAGAGSVMPTFHAIDGVPGTCNTWLLQDVLRKKWNFPGLIVSDYEAIRELMMHRLGGNWDVVGKLALRAGVTMEMRSMCYAYASNSLNKEELAILDGAVRLVLRQKMELGLFEQPSVATTEYETATLLHADHLALARRAAAQACVLLKNEGQTLPIPATAKKIAVLGDLARDSVSALGSWPGDGRAEDVITLVDALKKELGEDRVLAPTATPPPTTGFRFIKPNAGLDFAKDADYILLALGETADQTGEAACKSNLDLPTSQLNLLKKVQELGKPYAVILMTGRPLTVSSLQETCPAILLSWYGGTMSGPGLVDVLLGKVNPSGKLPVTFPRHVGQIPLTYDATPTGRPYRGDAEKWVSRYTDIENSPLWPFGFGLSYTSFTISRPKLAKVEVARDGIVEFSIAVKNTGKVDGTEVVQVYTRAVVSSIARPNMELKAFRRVPVAAGKTETVTFQIPATELGYYNSAGERILEAGSYNIMIGNSSVTSGNATVVVP